MENPQPAFFQRILQSHAVLIGIAVTVLIVVVSTGIFLFIRQSSQKPALEQIPEEAIYTADEIVVKFKEGYLPSPSGESKEWDALYPKLQALGVEQYEQVFDSDDPSLRYHYRLKLKKGSNVEAIREELYKLPEIESSEPDYYFEAQAGPNDPYYPSMWHLQKIQSENAWNINKGSSSVTVAVIDTGIDRNHPDFAGRTFVPGKDFVTCNNIVVSGGQSTCAEPKSIDNDPMDDHYHGTHVAGTIGAVSNNGVGVSGINWNVKLMAVKVLNKKGQGAGSIADGIRYAVDNGANVINMSLGGKGTCAPDSSYQTAINYARSKGVVVIVAAGNDNSNASGFMPANCNGTIVVGATGPNDERAAYSNFDASVAIAAPGGNKRSNNCSASDCITSTIPGAKYNVLQGTSMATPHVAGVAALILAQNPAFTPDDVRRCLIDSADPISTDKPIGGKRLNAYAALNGCSRSSNPQVTSGVTTTPPTSVSPSALPTRSAGAYYIRGFVFDDKNKNTIKDGDEGTLSGAVVTLSGAVNRPAVTTGSDGSFSFTGLTPGDYQVVASVNSNPIVQYRFSLNNELPSIVLPVPIPEQEGQAGAPITTGAPGSVTGTPSPTPRPLFTCKERTSNRQVNNKTVQIKYLECTPK